MDTTSILGTVKTAHATLLSYKGVTTLEVCIYYERLPETKTLSVLFSILYIRLETVATTKPTTTRRYTVVL